MDELDFPIQQWSEASTFLTSDLDDMVCFS